DEVIVPYLNDQNKKYAWRDKCYFYQFIPSVTFPKIIFKRINDRYYDENGNLINDIYNSNIKELLIKQENIIFKPGFGAFGRAVEKHHITSNSDAEKLITDHEYLQHYLVQEVVKQHKFFDQFNSSSVNIMRINTLFHNGKVEILDNAMVRFGLPGYHTDVAFVNGKEIVRAVGITKEGHLKSHFWDLYGHKSKLEEYEYTEVPMWDEVRKTVIDGASKMPYFSFIAWDVTVNDQNEVVVIEYNIDFPGSVIYQYDQPFFGNVTDSLLNEIKLHHEIPRFYRN
ncbi:MAG: sugar-transfer associated ATP-grasp domain-containing protein, partial [Lachnospiraceae bacterium]|nr:sugar-transfer associated ATP-grasp domain-containing protein [Lachnospiraceae bacterium]